MSINIAKKQERNKNIKTISNNLKEATKIIDECAKRVIQKNESKFAKKEKKGKPKKSAEDKFKEVIPKEKKEKPQKQPVIKNTVKEVDKKSKSYFVDKLKEYDYLIDEKEKRLSELESELEKGLGNPFYKIFIFNSMK